MAMIKLELDGHRTHSAWDGLYTGHVIRGTYNTRDMYYMGHVVQRTCSTLGIIRRDRDEI